MPLIHAGRTIGMLGLANREGGFRPEDLEAAEALAPAVLQALLSKRIEDRLRESEEQRSFLLLLSDKLQVLETSAEISGTAFRLLGDRLRASRVFYADVNNGWMVVERDYARGVDSIVGEASLACFGTEIFAEYRVNNLVLVPDVTEDTRIDEKGKADLLARGVAAHADFVLLEQEESIGLLAVQSAAPRRWTRHEQELIRQVGERVRSAVQRARAEMGLRASEARQRALVEGVPQLIWRAINGGRWTWSSPQWSAHTSLSVEESRGLGWLQALHPEDREAASEAWASSEAGQPLVMETRVFSNAENRYRWLRTRATPVRDPAGRVQEWLGTSTDIDDLRQPQDQQEVLIHELQHRTRNLIGVIQSLAIMSLADSASFEAAKESLLHRLGALARVQGLLSGRSGSERVEFGDLLRTELAAHDALNPNKVVLKGPAGIPLRSGAVQTFALALHELATSATKYGALNQPGGHLRISWRLAPPVSDGSTWLHVEWRESGVAVSRAGEPRLGGGYGRELIKWALPHQLGARRPTNSGRMACAAPSPRRSSARR